MSIYIWTYKLGWWLPHQLPKNHPIRSSNCCVFIQGIVYLSSTLLKFPFYKVNNSCVSRKVFLHQVTGWFRLRPRDSILLTLQHYTKFLKFCSISSPRQNGLKFKQKRGSGKTMGVYRELKFWTFSTLLNSYLFLGAVPITCWLVSATEMVGQTNRTFLHSQLKNQVRINCYFIFSTFIALIIFLTEYSQYNPRTFMGKIKFWNENHFNNIVPGFSSGAKKLDSEILLIIFFINNLLVIGQNILRFQKCNII